MQCDILEAKNQLSKLVQAALADENVVITDKGLPVVRLVKVGTHDSARKPGAWSNLPNAKVGWDSDATDAAILDPGFDSVMEK